METLDCHYKGHCGGCPWGTKPFSEHLAAKKALIDRFAPNAEIVLAPRGRVRDRADMMWQRLNGQMRFGLFALESREVVDLHSCTMMSPALEAWFKVYRTRIPAIEKGSVRLRVSPSGERGVWLDFSNQDVKQLFDEREYLKWLSEHAFVEIGQRRKALIWREGTPKLVDPILKPWFETYDRELKPLPLYSPVGGFSQVGFAANRVLVQTVCDLVSASGLQSWLELFCGNGNFALALASRGLSVEAVEMDHMALEGLKLGAQGLAQPPEIQRADVYLQTGRLPRLSERGLLVDPPRAGLREVLSVLEKGDQPNAIVYVSCFSEVLVTDAARLATLGYKLSKILGVDQFPFTPHNEWVALFVK